MSAVFLDTSYLLALELSNDQNHRAAQQHWQGLMSFVPRLVTTSYVFDETVTFFNNRGYHAKAVQVGNTLLRSPSMELVHIDETLFHAAWSYFQQHWDKTYSLTDCVSFIVMSKLGIARALTIDKHFVQAGFDKLP